ncbi:outer membrane protein assembly factor BamB family protein, partial [Streptomyces longispororuber]|uniref:outer membrane protein assembly factor BamB family protein n=1 Tax=Streptomyces longispororuber TaxID=68230 RepID=UPI00210D1A15
MFLLAVVVLLGVGGWYVWPSSSKEPVSLEGKATEKGAPDAVRETVEGSPKGGAGHIEGVVVERGLAPGRKLIAPGMWATDKVLAKGKGSSLVATNIADESDAWTRQLDGDICAVTQDVTNDGRAAVAFKDPAGDHLCNQVVMFRVGTGEKVWQAKIPVKRGFFAEATRMTLTQGVVATSWNEGSAGLDMATGKVLWQRGRTKQCHDGGFTGGRALLLRYDCFDKKSQRDHYRVQELSPRTGKAQWTYKVAPGVEFAYIISSDPVVLAVAAGDYDVTNLISLSDRGKYRAGIRMEGDHYNVECDPDSVDGCTGATVAGDRVLVTSGDVSEELGNNTNWVVTFDLATGHSGKKFEAGPDQRLSPLRASGDQVLALKVSTDTVAPNSLVSLDPKSGKQRTYFYFTIPDELHGVGASELMVEHGRIFFGNQEFRGSGKKETPDAQWLAYGVA